MTRDSLPLADQKIGDIDYYAGSGLWRRASTLFTAVTFNAGDYTAQSGTWTVGSGDVNSFNYLLLGKMMTVTFNLVTTSVSATPVDLRILVPAGKTISKRADTAGICSDNGGTRTYCQIVAASGTSLQIFFPAGAATWAASTNATDVTGETTFEVQ